MMIADELEKSLRAKFDVVEHRLTVGGKTFNLRHPRSADDLIDDAAFDRDERLPYWAEIWPSAYVLAERILAEDGTGRTLLELGCGAGLATIAALAAGFEVTAIDYYAEALQFVELNAALNGLPTPKARVVDWRDYPADLTGFDVVIAADVLYEREYCRLVANAMRQSLLSGGLGLLTDPQRVKAEPFPAECRAQGLQVVGTQIFGPLSVPGGDPHVRQTVNLLELRG